MTSSTEELFDLTGRRAIVTGGAGLLGRVFVRALLDLGAEVHLFDVDEPRLESTLAEIPDRAAGASGVVCDVTDEAAVETAVRSVADSGSIDVLVNSAALDPKVERGGSSCSGGLLEYGVGNWRRSLEVNLTGTFVMTKAVVRVMIGQGDRGRGCIVNIASTYALRGPDQRIYGSPTDAEHFFKPPDYPTTKAGALGFTRAMAAALRGTEIRVNALTPGGALDDQDNEFVQSYSARTVLGRMADPSEYRGPIAFLCSDASSYMTGANLVVDGGWTAF